MQIHWTCEGCDQDDETRLEQHWEQVQIELDGKVASLSDVASELRMAVYHDDAGPPWQIHAALHLPGQTLVAECRGRNAEEALNRILSELSDRIDRVEDANRPLPLLQRNSQELLPFLKQCRERQHSKAFFSFLVPVLDGLKPYVQQELQIRERDEELSNGITPADVLDETLLRAWDGFAECDASRRLDLWLIQIIDRVIQEAGDRFSGQSLEEEQVLPKGSWVGSDQDEWVDQASYPSAIELAELLPGNGGVADWDALAVGIKQAHLAEILGDLPRERRQAFVLNVAHGYNLAEIADFQDREATAVKEDISQAIGAIRRAVTEERAPDVEERFDRAKGRDRYRRRR